MLKSGCSGIELRVKYPLYVTRNISIKLYTLGYDVVFVCRLLYDLSVIYGPVMRTSGFIASDVEDCGLEKIRED